MYCWWEMYDSVVALGNTLAALQMAKCRVTTTNSCPGFIPNGNEDICSHKILCMYVLNSITPDSQKMEVTQASMNDE